MSTLRNIALIVATLMMSFCTVIKEDPFVSGFQTVRLTVNVYGLFTKTLVQTEEESRVNTVDFFVFDVSAGELLCRERSTGGTLTMDLPKAVCEIWALVNAPASVSELETRSAVSSYHPGLAQQARGSFFMSGCVTEDLDGTTTDIVINVRRDVSRVDLMTAPTFGECAAGGVFDAAYLINVPKEYAPDAIITSAADAWNFEDAVVSESEQNGLLKITSPGSLYCLPNFSPESTGPEGRDYVTKLVIKATIGGQISWFPVGIPNIGANRHYVVDAIHISDTGTDAPNDYLYYRDFNEGAQAWTYSMAADIEGYT